jgi:hypothetical protein
MNFVSLGIRDGIVNTSSVLLEDRREQQSAWSTTGGLTIIPYQGRALLHMSIDAIQTAIVIQVAISIGEQN